jgi:hypothetical protein
MTADLRGDQAGPGRGPRETALFAAVDALTDVDPYADARPPDGECYCGGCVGMGPCEEGR